MSEPTTKTADQIFAEADEILENAFYVVDVSELETKTTKQGKPYYPKSVSHDGDDFKIRPYLCEIAALAPIDGGLGRGEAPEQPKTAKETTKKPEYFNAQAERLERRKATRAERLEDYREQVSTGLFDENESLEYHERHDFASGAARNDSFTNTHGLSTHEE